MICRLARLNRSFCGAASADFVWESKLMDNYRYLVDKLFDEIPADIYTRLCRPFPSCTKEVWLEKNLGGICLSISAKALSIMGINDGRYWNYIPSEESSWRRLLFLQL